MRERALLGAAIVAWFAISLALYALHLPLKHDEAQYALAARGDITWLNLSTGTVAIARMGLALGDARLAALVMNGGVVVATWWLGCCAFDRPSAPAFGGAARSGKAGPRERRIGAYAAAVIAGAHPFVLRSADLIADLPAAACAVTGIAILVRELERESGPSWWLVSAALAFAAAFYFRYGHAPLVALVAVAALACYPRQLLARPVVVATTVLAFFALLLPHALASLHATGSVLGIVRFGAHMPARSFVGEGLVAYTCGNPFALFGALGMPLVITGVAGTIKPGPRRRATWFLAAIALGQIAVIGLETRAQPRYIYVATILLVAIGCDAVRRVAPPRLARFALPLIALAWLATAIAAVPVARQLAAQRRPASAAADAIRADAADRPCVIATLQLPQLMWQTRCEVLLAWPPIAWPDDRRSYLVSLPGNEVEVAAFATAATELPVADPRARVWRITPASP